MPIVLWTAALLLFAAAVTLGFIAWRMARGARLRETARVELLRGLAFPDGFAAAAPGRSMSNWTPGFVSEEQEKQEEEETARDVDTFEPTRPIVADRKSLVTGVPRWWISIVASGAVIAALVGAVSARFVSPDNARTTAPTARATAAPDNPIELIALQSQLENGTAFVVTGVVRNPVDGHELSQLMAVVELLDANGRILASDTTEVERAVLAAGQTSTFSLVFQRLSGTVASYKVRFRSAGGDPIPHVDRRAPQPAAKVPLS